MTRITDYYRALSYHYYIVCNLNVSIIQVLGFKMSTAHILLTGCVHLLSLSLSLSNYFLANFTYLLIYFICLECLLFHLTNEGLNIFAHWGIIQFSPIWGFKKKLTECFDWSKASISNVKMSNFLEIFWLISEISIWKIWITELWMPHLKGLRSRSRFVGDKTRL